MRLYLKKSKLRKTLRNYVLKNISKISKLYDIIQSKLLRKVVIFSNRQYIPEDNQFTVTTRNLFRNYCETFPSRNEMVYKNVNHKISNFVSRLLGDIEPNPGPFVLDSSKTIHAPYSQGNSLVFGSNAGN